MTRPTYKDLLAFDKELAKHQVHQKIAIQFTWNDDRTQLSIQVPYYTPWEYVMADHGYKVQAQFPQDDTRWKLTGPAEHKSHYTYTITKELT